MDPVKAKMMYPDATFTMRVSYGAVKSYRPRDAVFYDYVTTSKGLLEKYKAGDYEFDLPAKQIELLKKKDFGQYMDPTRKDLVIGFITTNDITGDIRYVLWCIDKLGGGSNIIKELKLMK